MVIPCALSVRTNPCSVAPTGETGTSTAQEQSGEARAGRATQPRSAAPERNRQQFNS